LVKTILEVPREVESKEEIRFQQHLPNKIGISSGNNI